jgi:hypothetical protein
MTSFADNRFDLGRVISRTFSVIIGDFVRWTFLSVFMIGGPQLLMTVATSSMTNPTGPIGALAPGFLGGAAGIGIYLLGLAVLVIANVGIIYGSVRALSGHRATISEIVSRTWPKGAVLLGLWLVQGLAIGLGFGLIVPGLILMVMWIVATPAVIVENRDIGGALQRSQDLTQGHRWAIFGLILLYFAAIAVLFVILIVAAEIVRLAIVFVAVWISGVSPPPPTLSNTGRAYWIFTTFINCLWAPIASLVGAVGSAALYVELRGAREGSGDEALTDVFA